MLWAREIVYFGQSIQIYIRVSALKYFQNQILIKCFVDCFSSKISTSIVSVQQKRQKLCFDTAIIKIWFPLCTEHSIVPYNSENCKMSCFSQKKSCLKKKINLSVRHPQELLFFNLDWRWTLRKKILTFCDSVRETPLVSDDESLSGKLNIKAV